jgi:transposase
MARMKLTVMKYEEIRRLKGLGLSDRQIAKSLRCSRNTVKGIREGGIQSPEAPKVIEGPIWAKQVNWDEICRERSLGYELKYIWEERAKDRTTYSNFWKQFYRKFPQYKDAMVVHREFKPGEYCEVDWAGKHLEWVSPRTGEIHQVSVFIGVLCFSQLIFAVAKENQKSRHWIEAHQEMYEYFGGVAHVTVPDCLKTGVTKYHLYDPELNESYIQCATHYGTAVVPARAYHPKDKALAENTVGRFMRYFKFKYRNHTFCSLAEINLAIRETADELNRKPHSRFRVSRLDRWEAIEKKQLKPLPPHAYEYSEWKNARVHPDCYVAAESNLYSVPHIHRGKEVRIRLGAKCVEIFSGLERLAIHGRYMGKKGKYITDPNHLPENAKTYYETTPQNVLSQAKYLNPDLGALIDSLFQKDALGNLRRAQGLVRVSRKEINTLGKLEGAKNISRAVEIMQRFSKIRVPYFRELLKHYRKEKFVTENKNIVRDLNNPMLRYQKPKPGVCQGIPQNDIEQI